MPNIKNISITGAVTDDDAIALSQTPSGAGNLTINGVLASLGVATLVPAGRVAIKSLSDISNRTFVITGTDRYGYAQSETITGPNNNTVYTSKNFLTVTQISISGTAAGAVLVGTNGIASTQWYPGDYKTGKPPILTVALSTGAVLTYTVEFTTTNLNDQALNITDQITQAQNAVVFPSTDSAVVAASTNQATNFIEGVPGIRLTLNSYTSGTATMAIVSPNNSTA